MTDSAQGTMTQAQMQAMMTAQMQATMTPAMQAQMQAFAAQRVATQHTTTTRLPVDDSGKAFTRFAACTVQQPTRTEFQVPPTLVGQAAIVISTSGERVRVQYPNGEQREFHRTELGIR